MVGLGEKERVVIGVAPKNGWYMEGAKTCETTSMEWNGETIGENKKSWGQLGVSEMSRIQREEGWRAWVTNEEECVVKRGESMGQLNEQGENGVSEDE
eukprot:1485009-Pleurochrysis_carterae.AAC.1